MKKLFTFLSRANNNSIGISFNHRRVSFIYSMLTLVAIMLMMPSSMRGAIVTDAYYDFKGSIDNGDTQVTLSGNFDETYTGCQYFSKIGNVNNPGRLACGDDRGVWEGKWILTESHKLGLYALTGGTRQFLVSQLSKGSIVTFDVVDTSNNPQTISLVSNNATAEGNKFTMTQGGVLVVGIPRYLSIKTITIQHDDAAYWAYDPAIESYDLYWVNKNTEISTSDAGFALNVSGENAQYLSISSPTLNNRIAISQKYSAEGHHFTTDELWTFGRDGYGDESQGLLVKIGWNNLSICNLKEGDRVRLTLSGQATFSSKGQNGGYDGCSAFKDINCNGDQDEGEVSITPGLPVESPNNNGGNYKSYFYTITEDGHLDIGLSEGSRLCQVEIYADHQAKMIDRDNALDSKTSYFDTTGQLEAKHHIVPGGLHVYIGNDSPNEHAEVVMSDKGPVSFVYDYHDENSHHYKMARHSVWGSINVWSGLPTTGTYYKFVPEVTGKMWVKFKAANLTYHNYGKPGNVAYNDDGTPNEKTMNVYCPYYLMVEQNGSFQQVENPHYYANGADGYFGSDNGNPTQGTDKGITVEAGKTYYLYGWWQDGTDVGQLQNYGCGVAELIEVTFLPNQYISPLAKWVDSKTTSDDDLASVTGYTTVTVKKKSDNIASCTAKIEGGKLKISNITFVDENKGGGTILLKVGDPNNDGDPVFAYTIAYNAGYNQPEGAVRSEGHTWDFSTNPLNGLKWNNKNAEADVTSFGTRFNNFATADKDDNGIPTNGVNNSSLLTEEINKGDWTFNYRVKKNGQFHDPRFLNNYDMEGDNADMMWDTEGLIINAGSTQSCIFNEFGGTVAHTEDDDPDRYVGFLPGSELIIPKLRKNDRVYIYMGSGNGSGQTAMKFKITNALDALYNPIDESDEYWAGGSQWNIPTSDVREYHGCYHFFAAADGDMKIKMSSGSMCKLYKIKIYRGDHEDTNGIQEKTGGYTLLSTYGQGGETKTWSLHYRGKGETLADGNGKFLQENEIIAQTGKISNTTISTNGNDFSYTSAEGDLGTIRVRVKCMEYNHNYVTDYADRNLTLAYHKTMNYPYTWDFMDMDVAEFSGDDIDAEWTRNKGVSNNIKENKPYETASAYNLSMWDADGKMRVNSQVSDPHNYNYIFQNLKGDNGNQLWANNDILPETQGLWFYMDNNDPLYSGCMQIDADGMHLINNASIGGRGWWNYKMVVPSVPAGAAVYLRMARDTRVPEFNENDEIGENNIANSYSYDLDKQTQQWNKNPYKMQKYQFAHMSEKAEIEDGTNCRFYEAEDESGDYIVAIKNTGSTSNLTLTLNGWTLKKMSVSTDIKRIGKSGYATESRARDIDHNLTGYLTGKPVKAYTASLPTSGHAQVLLTQIGAEEDDAKILPAVTTNGAVGGCILYHNGGVQETVDGENVMNRTLSVLDGGFHEFVPDMHDKDNEDLKVNTSGNILKAFKPVKGEETTIYPEQKDQLLAPTEGSNTNMILSTVRYTYNGDGTNKSNGYEAFFIRVDPNKTGAKMWQSTAYIQLPTLDLKTLTGGANGAKMSIVFADDFFIQNSGITTAIDDALQSDGQAENENNAEWYNLNGQKLNSKPTSSGLYIVNGKKVMVK